MYVIVIINHAVVSSNALNVINLLPTILFQLLIRIVFQQPVKLHSIRIEPSQSGGLFDASFSCLFLFSVFGI